MQTTASLMNALGMLKPTGTEAVLHTYVDATVKRRTLAAYDRLAKVLPLT